MWLNPKSEQKEERKKLQGLFFSARQGKGGKTLSLEETCVQEETALRTIQMTQEEDLELEEMNTWYSVLIRLTVSISFGAMFQC